MNKRIPNKEVNGTKVYISLKYPEFGSVCEESCKMFQNKVFVTMI